MIHKPEKHFQIKFKKDGYKILRNGWPDFLLIKDSKISFVEVKGSSDKLRKPQIKMLKVLNHYGLSCYIWNPEGGLINFKDYPLIVKKTKLKVRKKKLKLLDKKELIELRIKMLKKGITFSSMAQEYNISRQRIHQIIKAGYPAEGKKKRILDDFFGRLAG